MTETEHTERETEREAEREVAIERPDGTTIDVDTEREAETETEHTERTTESESETAEEK